MKRADLILHPVRLRIILAFARGRRLTPQQVAAVLPDVPQATLYRQIERLYQGGALAVASERRVRGAVERTYVLAEGGASLLPEELANASRDDHLAYFTAFAAGPGVMVSVCVAEVNPADAAVIVGEAAVVSLK